MPGQSVRRTEVQRTTAAQTATNARLEGVQTREFFILTRHCITGAVVQRICGEVDLTVGQALDAIRRAGGRR